MGKEDIIKHQFKKGNKLGKGRPPRLVSSVLKELQEKGHERVSKSAVRDVYEYLIGLNKEELTKLSKDKKTPMLFSVIAKEIIGKKGFEVIERMLDRAHGKASQSNEIELSGKKDNPIVWKLIK